MTCLNAAINAGGSRPRSCPQCGLFSTICTAGVRIEDPFKQRYGKYTREQVEEAMSKPQTPPKYAMITKASYNEVENRHGYSERIEYTELTYLDGIEEVKSKARQNPHAKFIEYRELTVKTEVIVDVS